MHIRAIPLSGGRHEICLVTKTGLINVRENIGRYPTWTCSFTSSSLCTLPVSCMFTLPMEICTISMIMTTQHLMTPQDPMYTVLCN